jgi:hypothetical protein
MNDFWQCRQIRNLLAFVNVHVTRLAIQPHPAPVIEAVGRVGRLLNLIDEQPRP